MSLLLVLKAVLTVDASVMTYSDGVSDCMQKTINYSHGSQLPNVSLSTVNYIGIFAGESTGLSLHR